MSETPKFYNPSEYQKPTQKKDKKEKKTKEKKQVKAQSDKRQSTRSIRFKKRGVQDSLSVFFWFLIIAMSILVFVSYSRYGLLLKKVNQKSVDSNQIMTQLHQSNSLENKARYESQRFIEQLFTYSKDNAEERKVFLENRLSNGLTESMLMTNLSKKDQQVMSIVFVDSDVISKEKEQYSFTYDIHVLSEDSEEAIQMKLPVSIQQGDFKVINYPTYINVELSDNSPKNEIVYQEKDYLTKGEKIDTEEKKSLEAFTQDFFKLYVTNDDSLKLISNVKGLTNATLRNVLIKNCVKKDKYFIVEGTFNVSYDESSDMTSFFSLTINKTNDTYFVTQIN